MNITIKPGDFVSDFGVFCLVAMIDTSFKPERVVLVDLSGKMSLQDINSLQLMEGNHPSDAIKHILYLWAEKTKKSYHDLKTLKPTNETQNRKTP